MLPAQIESVPSAFYTPGLFPDRSCLPLTQAVGRIIEGWHLVVDKRGFVYSEFKKQYD